MKSQEDVPSPQNLIEEDARPSGALGLRVMSDFKTGGSIPGRGNSWPLNLDLGVNPALHVRYMYISLNHVNDIPMLLNLFLYML